MTVFVRKADKILAKGKNLSVITRYGRTKAPITGLSVRGVDLKVTYADGAKTITKFGGIDALFGWASRKARQLHVPLKVAAQATMEKYLKGA
jgi:hypothetical protein